VIGKFYIGECYCILHALGNKKEGLVVFNMADFHNSPNRQNKFYAKFSSYTVCPSKITMYTVTSIHTCCHVQQYKLYFNQMSGTKDQSKLPEAEEQKTAG